MDVVARIARSACRFAVRMRRHSPRPRIVGTLARRSRPLFQRATTRARVPGAIITPLRRAARRCRAVPTRGTSQRADQSLPGGHPRFDSSLKPLKKVTKNVTITGAPMRVRRQRPGRRRRGRSGRHPATRTWPHEADDRAAHQLAAASLRRASMRPGGIRCWFRMLEQGHR